mgnify:CR=1 FL=1
MLYMLDTNICIYLAQRHPPEVFERLEAHEAVHVRQWRVRGGLGFLVGYLGEYLRGRLIGRRHHDAYLHLSAECEAEWEAQRQVRGLPIR